jgi:glycosyltransferase involved in cell wall biosynthesis
MNAPMPGVLFAGFLPGTGYGNATRDYLAVLRSHGVDVQWIPLQFGSPLWGREYYAAPPQKKLPTSIANAGLSAKRVDPAVAVMHTPRQFWAKLRSEYPARRTLALTTFEQSVLPEVTVGMLNTLDGVIVPSLFNFDSFRASGVTVPMWVVPHAVSPILPAKPTGPGDTAPLPVGIGPKTFVVSVIGPWQARKAIAASIEAFLRAFGPEEDVLLVVKTSVDDFAKRRPAAVSVAEILGRRSRVPRLHLITEDLPYDQFRALTLRSDCSLSLSRGEGFGLTIAEAVAMGTPAVTTGWGAPLEWLGPDYPLFVRHDMVEAASEPTDGWAETTGQWAMADIDHAASLLRWVHDHPDMARPAVLAAQHHLASICAPQIVALRMLDALNSH